MKHIATFAAVVALAMVVGGAPTADARAQNRSWEETRSYGAPNVIGIDTDVPGIGLNEVQFEPGRANTMHVAVEDDVAPVTIAVVWQGDSALATICTASDEPVEIRPALTVRVTLYMGTCDSGPVMVSSGSVSATFSRR